MMKTTPDAPKIEFPCENYSLKIVGRKTADYPTWVVQCVQQLAPDLDPKKVKMLGTGQWDTGGLGSEPALLGGWFSSPSSQGRREFVIRYENIYGETPHRLATLAYDATALAAVFAQSNKDDRQIKLPSKTQFFRNMNITSPRGFLGLDGIFRFSKKGYVERGLSVFEIKTRGIKLISPAPQKFFSQDKG